MTPLSFIIYFVAVIILTASMVGFSYLLNPFTTPRKNNLPFESGIVPQGSTDLRWNVNYFLVAILFVIFDIEAVFIYVWAIVVVDTGWPAYLAVCSFIGSLLIALVYQWRMGVLEWGKKLSSPLRQELPKIQPIPPSVSETSAATSSQENV